MIITDKNARPSERFIEVIKPYFFNLGYSYKKSDKTFIKTFDRGFYEVGFWFRISTLTDVSLHWSIQMTKFEKLVILIRKERLTKGHHTAGADMANHTRWETVDVEHTIPLYDQRTLTYDDFSINSAADKIIKGYEQYVVPYFEKYTDYSFLEKWYNKNEYRTIKGLILAKYIANPEYGKLVEALKKQILERSKGRDSEELLQFYRAIELLEKNDIQKLLD